MPGDVVTAVTDFCSVLSSHSLVKKQVEEQGDEDAAFALAIHWERWDYQSCITEGSWPDFINHKVCDYCLIW